ncbi:hypothetical protein DFH07DRAFT_230063 [Mycena maculata]|uniref:Uncharacterized protein n=1 Tax=Mycena maculata TaxID=230809 RepID=A0AAD7HT11_9AGAR|nr:hypothetical protein DFH07DRAFT_230063 [Mycena maculata]
MDIIKPSIRRKPIHTYQSPAAAASPNVAKTLSALSQNLASTSASTPASKTTSVSTTNIIVRTGLVPRKKYPMAPPLPLYHPLGRLALSLPPLEPSSFGHSTRISVDDSDSGRRSSARSRRPAAKLRDLEEDEPPSRPAPISNVSAIAAVAAREIKEKASPRKKRAGGGAGAKRKRKDVDDGDATYPAKRTRNPRGASNVADDASPTDSVMPLPEVTPTPEPTGEPQDDSKRPERRSTRSSGSLKRRDSSASEATSVSASVPGTRGVSKVNETQPMNIDPLSDTETRNSGGPAKEAKEEGEVSEEAP